MLHGDCCPAALLPEAGKPAAADAVMVRELVLVEGQRAAIIEDERVFRAYCLLFLTGEFALLRAPLAIEGADVLRVGAHAYIHHEALGTFVDGGDGPLPPGPGEVPVKAYFASWALQTAAAEGDGPGRRSGLRRGAVGVGERYRAVVKTLV